MRVRVGPKVVGLVRGEEKHFEPIERKPADHDTAKCGYIWTESGTRVVLTLRETSAIREEQQSVNIGNSMHRRKNV